MFETSLLRGEFEAKYFNSQKWHLALRLLLYEMKIIVAYFILAIFAAVSHAKDSFDFSCSKPNSNEAAVLVLAPGMNMDGEFFLKESPWMDFAKRNNLGVIALNYSSSEEDLYQNRKGYYCPEQGSGQALLDKIKRVYGKDLPIILYGFSGGAQFVSRFVDWRPDRIVAWCA